MTVVVPRLGGLGEPVVDPQPGTVGFDPVPGRDVDEFRTAPDLATAHFVRTRGGARGLPHRLATRTKGWDEVVGKLGYEHLRRHDLRHTGLTWLADAGVPISPPTADRG
jgi:integrase